MVKKTVIVSLVRTARSEALRAKKDDKIDSTSKEEPADVMRMRLTFDVTEDDAPRVAQVIKSIQSKFERTTDAKLARIAHRPGVYAVHVNIACAIVPSDVCQYAAQFDAYVDLESNQIILNLEKSLRDVD
jgi:hypothetical protein